MLVFLSLSFLIKLAMSNYEIDCYSLSSCARCQLNSILMPNTCHWEIDSEICRTNEDNYTDTSDISNLQMPNLYFSLIETCKNSVTSLDPICIYEKFYAPAAISIFTLDSNIIASNKGIDKVIIINSFYDFLYCNWTVISYTHEITLSFDDLTYSAEYILTVIIWKLDGSSEEFNTMRKNTQSYDEVDYVSIQFLELAISGLRNVNINLKITIPIQPQSRPESSESYIVTTESASSSSSGVDQLMIIIPSVSIVVCCFACCGILCSCIKKTKDDIDLDNRRVRSMNLAGVIEFSRFRNVESIGNINPNAIIINEDHRTRSLRILKEKLETGELKGEKYLESKNVYKSGCTICIEQFVKNAIIVKLDCLHIFHKECLKEWLEKNITRPKCPNCNFNVLFKTYDKVDEQAPSNQNEDQNINAVAIFNPIESIQYMPNQLNPFNNMYYSSVNATQFIARLSHPNIPGQVANSQTNQLRINNHLLSVQRFSSNQISNRRSSNEVRNNRGPGHPQNLLNPVVISTIRNLNSSSHQIINEVPDASNLSITSSDFNQAAN